MSAESPVPGIAADTNAGLPLCGPRAPLEEAPASIWCRGRLTRDDHQVTPEQFAAGIKMAAFHPGVRGTLKKLEQGPPGRGPHPA